MPRHPSIPIARADQAGAPGVPHSAARRRVLQLMAASTALATAGCSGPPPEDIVSYVQMPEQLVPGQPVFYASAHVRRGYGHGVLLETNMGRPTKVEGNPDHPASAGATDVYAQASVLQLWDPDRSQSVWGGAAVSTWQAFGAALQPLRRRWQDDGGAGLRILTGTVTSPTLADQLAALLARYPQAQWHTHDPLHDDAAVAAAQIAFGQPLDTLLHCANADVVVSFDADLFGDWPGALGCAREFTRRRNGAAGARLYVLESCPSLTGAAADERLALAPATLEWLVWRLAARFGLAAAPPPRRLPIEVAHWESALAALLERHRGRSLLAAGGTLPAGARALVHLLNVHLGNVGNTVGYVAPAEARPGAHLAAIQALAADMHGGAVGALFIAGANPVYDAPAGTGFGAALARVPLSVHLGLYRDETAHRCSWHLPQAHNYEHWSDVRAFDGAATIVQPLIAPLYGGRSLHQLLGLLQDGDEGSDLVRVRATWQGHAGADGFDAFWQRSVRVGMVAGSAAVPVPVAPAAAVPVPDFALPRLVAVFVADHRVGDGEFANNAWLQELPHPLTKLTWDNAAMLSAATAALFGLETGDVVTLSLARAPALRVDAPVLVVPGHADGCVTLPLGYGRTHAGRVGNGVGFDAYRLRQAGANGKAELTIRKTGRRHEFAFTQTEDRMAGRELVRVQAPGTVPPWHAGAVAPSLYPPVDYPHYKWGMAIDLNSCIGCGACTIACQAENNIPVVGKEQVLHGRAMHWIRVDRYYTGPAQRPRTLFQPVPCMHCETAPCEEVCPVGATVHDSEGLNVQVYNRCVGTRFCSNNCPYKVRRFNFLKYNDDAESLKAQRNPEVTVRRRGVMEKCTYCIQRVTRARIDAEKLGRRIHDGEVVTACQAVCPTGAIVFGDLNDPASLVNRAKASARDYALLAELNTRPRTTYAARVLDPGAALLPPEA